MDKVSIIVPCYNEEETVPVFFETVEEILKNAPFDYEYVFINDGSEDKTLQKLRELYILAPDKVRFASFSRNFGKEAGLLAGLTEAVGDYSVVMDVDLQDPPEMLLEMYDILQKEPEIDVVGTRRVTRDGEPAIRSLFAKLFYKIINKISDAQIIDGARDYRMMRKAMVDSILSLTERNRFSKGIFSWVGYNTKYLEYKNIERVAGNTSWSFWSLLRYSIDGIVSFSEAPLNISIYFGLFSVLIAFIGAVFIVVRTLLFGNAVQGWSSMVCIFLALGGAQLLCLGIIGKYIGKIYTEVKRRPSYLIKETEKTYEGKPK
ncbi:MAG: glycosyltransferase family 2 protein [Lactobacillales bacterium]|jgi:glycosyltransferase involved in cell wall biosynthesis|nr:glycosyltransferase family 2 protein [Lactobacillales bacterium]